VGEFYKTTKVAVITQRFRVARITQRYLGVGTAKGADSRLNLISPRRAVFADDNLGYVKSLTRQIM
jgi:hypothetical protein